MIPILSPEETNTTIFARLMGIRSASFNNFRAEIATGPDLLFYDFTRARIKQNRTLFLAFRYKRYKYDILACLCGEKTGLIYDKRILVIAIVQFV